MQIAKVVMLIIALRLVAFGQESNFVNVRLPAGISIDVPKNWWVISGDLNQTIETSAQAVLDLTGTKTSTKTNLLRANSMPRSTYAGISVNLYEKPPVSPNEIRTISRRELRLMDDGLRSDAEQGFKIQGTQILSWSGTRRDELDGNPTLITEYRRSGENGPVVVQINSIYGRNNLVRLTLSYRETEQVIWRPIVERMRLSFRIR